MAVHGHDRFINDAALVRGCEIMFAAERAKFSSTYHWITIIIRYLLQFGKLLGAQPTGVK